MIRLLLVLGSLLSGGLGIAVLGDQAWLHVKAGLAARLIGRAFEAHLADGRPHRPWQWADVAPIARVDVPRLGVSRIVLTGASGSSLAFGLGHVDGTARPGAHGNCAIAGHRDSWARFLRDVAPGDEVRVTTHEGTFTYRIDGTEVVPRKAVRALDDDGVARLTLVTCWPFGGVMRSPWRYVVTCTLEGGA